MRSRIALFAIALVLGTAALVSAQTAVESGTVVRVDPQSSVVVLVSKTTRPLRPEFFAVSDNRYGARLDPSLITFALTPKFRLLIFV